MDVARLIVGSVRLSTTFIYTFKFDRFESSLEKSQIRSHTRNWSPIFPEIRGPGKVPFATTVLIREFMSISKRTSASLHTID